MKTTIKISGDIITIKNKTATVADEPLAFVHYSKQLPADEQIFATTQEALDREMTGATKIIITKYFTKIVDPIVKLPMFYLNMENIKNDNIKKIHA